MEQEVHSNIYLAAVDVVVSLGVYAGVIVLCFSYLDWVHGIDVVGIVGDALEAPYTPFFGDLFRFTESLMEELITSAFLIGAVYAAYIANNGLTVSEEMIRYRKGFLRLKTGSIPMRDVQRVYTKGYVFFPRTKKLCVEALDEDTITVPYVRFADDVKESILKRVRKARVEKQTEMLLQRPITVDSEA
jgi:hypothetical protein